MLEKDMIKIILEHKPKSHIAFVKGSVVDMHVGAIVNAANTSLLRDAEWTAYRRMTQNKKG